MSHDDANMYWLRTGDTWTKIDYTQKPQYSPYTDMPALSNLL
jgi:hypothetical protein